MDPNKAQFISLVSQIEGITSPQKSRANKLADQFLGLSNNDPDLAISFYYNFLDVVELNYFEEMDLEEGGILDLCINKLAIFPLDTNLDGEPAIYIDLSLVNLQEIDLQTMNQVFILNILALINIKKMNKPGMMAYKIIFDCTEALYANLWRELLESFYDLAFSVLPAELSTIYVYCAPFIPKYFFKYVHYFSGLKMQLDQAVIYIDSVDDMAQRAENVSKLYRYLGGDADIPDDWVARLKSISRLFLFGNPQNRANLDISKKQDTPSSQIHKQTAPPLKEVSFNFDPVVTLKEKSQIKEEDSNANSFRSSFSKPESNDLYQKAVIPETLKNEEVNLPDTQASSNIDKKALENARAMRNKRHSYYGASDQSRYYDNNAEPLENVFNSIVDNYSGFFNSQFQNLSTNFAPNLDECVTSQKNQEFHYKPNFFIQDQSRVIIDYEKMNNYYNASFIDGVRREKKFICSESPRNNTIVGFLTMIWEYDIKVIGQLTSIEVGRCAPYYPTPENTILNIVPFVLRYVSHQSQTNQIIKTEVAISRDDQPGVEKTFSNISMDTNWRKAHGYQKKIVDVIHHELKIMRQYPILLHDGSGFRLPPIVVAIDIFKEMIELGKSSKISITKIIGEIRNQRNHCILAVDDLKEIYYRLISSCTRKNIVSKEFSDKIKSKVQQFDPNLM